MVRGVQKVIALYYHRIAPVRDRLSCPPELFEDQLRVLKRAGYQSISLSELREFLKGKPLSVEKPIILTFDDGFIDFWAHAFPLLEKYQFQAVVFLVPDWIEDSDQLPLPEQIQTSPAVKRSSGRAISSALQGDKSSFLNWKMIQKMAESQRVEFGSHGFYHRAGFFSPRIKKFLLSKNPRWVYRQIYQESFKPGFPAFERASELAIRRFLPEQEKLNQFHHYFQELFRNERLNKKQIEKRLFKFAKSLGKLGNYEPEAEAEQRILSELSRAREIIEERLQLACFSFCYPFGDYSELLLGLLPRAGYQLAFTTERGVITQTHSPFILPRYRVEAESGLRLVIELEAVKNSLLGKIISRFSRSREVKEV